MALSPISQKQARIICSGMPNTFWSKISGGDMAHEEIKFNDGNAGQEKTFSGMLSIKPLTLEKSHDPVADKEIQSFIKAQQANKTPFNITVSPVQADVAGTPLAGAVGTTYEGCTFLSYMPATFDRDGTGIAKVSMMFAVNALPTY
jgi:hypothetical protein